MHRFRISDVKFQTTAKNTKRTTDNNRYCATAVQHAINFTETNLPRPTRGCTSDFVSVFDENA